VLQCGESPVPENYENQRRDNGDKIRDRPALGTFVAIFARLPAHGMRLDFVWSRCRGGHRPILGPRKGLGQRFNSRRRWALHRFVSSRDSLIALATQSSSASETTPKPGYSPYNGTDIPIPPGNPKSEVHAGITPGGVCVP
jgi:hypothetical protein